jgi:hypothetical protein
MASGIVPSGRGVGDGLGEGAGVGTGVDVGLAVIPPFTLGLDCGPGTGLELLTGIVGI